MDVRSSTWHSAVTSLVNQEKAISRSVLTLMIGRSARTRTWIENASLDRHHACILYRTDHRVFPNEWLSIWWFLQSFI